MSFQAFAAHTAAHAGSNVIHPVTVGITQFSNRAWPIEMPGPGELVDMYLRGWINEHQLHDWGLSAGVAVDLLGSESWPTTAPNVANYSWLWEQFIYSRQELPSVEQVFVLTNRGIYSPADLDKLLRRHGFWHAETRADVANLRYEVPGPSDLVRFAVRHVFEPDLIQELGYADERDKGPYLLDIFHQAAGVNYPIFTGPLAPTVQLVTGQNPEVFAQFYASHGLKEPTWADAYWWSHWVLPSPGQAYQMYFRLRPDRDTKFDPPEAQGLTFPYALLDTLLRANDYPPIFRRGLAAIARPIPGLRLIRQMRATGTYTHGDVVELFRRMGFGEKDAQDQAATIERGVQDAAAKDLRKGVEKEVVEFWRLGMLSLAQAEQLLADAGLPEEEVQATLHLADVRDRVARTKEFESAIKSAYTKGSLSHDQARQAMLAFGLDPAWVDSELSVWAWVVKAKDREPTALQNVRYACEGLLTLEELAVRLTNLQYAADDVQLLVASARNCQAGLAARALAKADAAKRQAARDLRQQQQQHAQAIAQARRALAAHGSPAQLRKWYCEGTLGVSELYDRLRQLQWPDPDIARLVADCKGKRGGAGGAGVGASAPAGGG